MFRLLASHNKRVFIPYASIHPHTSSIVPASNADTCVCFLRSDSIRTSAPQSRLFLVVPGEASPPITEIVIPNSVTSIGQYAFAGLNNRKFNTLVLPNTIISIGAHAFDGASYLQTIHFGSVLEEIGDYAFNGCTRVKEMTCLAEITPNVGVDGLASISDLATLNVPNDYLFDYRLQQWLPTACSSLSPV